MTQEEMKKRLYEIYQLDWVARHGYSLADIMHSMDELIHDDHIRDTEDGMQADIVAIFDEWEDEHGFRGGSIWVCFDEFCMTELYDFGYMQRLAKVGDQWGDGGLVEAYQDFINRRKA